jgi:hypothetical protein
MMIFEFDHLFICTDVGASAADRLVAFGLMEGRSNIHAGQGTANRCFFFHNAMLELLWVRDAEEARSPLIRPTRLWERWIDRRDGGCPFGICLRGTTGDDLAFPSWDYHPPYLSATQKITVGANSDILTEPMLFQTPFAQRPDRYLPEKLQPLNHSIDLRELTRVELVTPSVDKPSAALQAAIDTQCLRIRSGGEYGVELGFDGEHQGRQMDFRPDLPLTICW